MLAPDADEAGEDDDEKDEEEDDVACIMVNSLRCNPGRDRVNGWIRRHGADAAAGVEVARTDP